MFSRILYPKPLRDEIRQVLAAAKLNVVDLPPRQGPNGLLHTFRISNLFASVDFQELHDPAEPDSFVILLAEARGTYPLARQIERLLVAHGGQVREISA